MKILALESSSRAASCALFADGRLLGESYLDCGLTHSQTLLPLVQSLCSLSGVPLAGLEGIAVSAGPGSFTGLRIGMAAAKALGAALGAPCAGVSTLHALACNLLGFEGTCCAVLDARCRQVYGALFALEGGGARRLCPDAAEPLEMLLLQARRTAGPLFLVGDGARICYNEMEKDPALRPRIRLAPPTLLLQRATGVAAAALEAQWRPAAELVPVYLRLSQAEREMLKKQEESK